MDLWRRGLPSLFQFIFKPAPSPATIWPRHRCLNSAVVTETSTSEQAATVGFHLRNYQEECIQAVLKYLDQGHKRLGISLATGAGKTVIFTQLIGRMPPCNGGGNRTLIVVHRRELAEQAARHCQLAYPNRSVEIEMGNIRASGTADITIASIRSLVSQDRILKLDPDQFKLVLVDEAHHIVAPSYREMLKHFRLDTLVPDSPALVGVSATFSRFDGQKLGTAIDHIVYHKDYVDMIEEEWLSDAVFTTVKSGADLSKVRKDKFGDFAIEPLSRAVNTDTSNDITVRAWLVNAQDRKSTLVFCVDVAHTVELTAMFRRHGIDARYITGMSRKEVRAEELRAFKNREYPVLLNCGLFTEGTDIPNIDCVLLARPTKSRNLFIQMIGRGLRLYPGKKDCCIIDMVANLRMGLLSTPTLFGLDPNEILNKVRGKELKDRQKYQKTDSSYLASEGAGNPPTSDCEDINLVFTKYDSVFDLIGDTKHDQHVRSMSPNAWVRIGPNRYVLSEKSGWLTIEQTDSGMFTTRYVMNLKDSSGKQVPTRPRVVASTSDLETAVHAADTFARSKFNAHFIASWQPWRTSPATSAQLQFLNSCRIRDKRIKRGDLSRGQAADMITKLRFGGRKLFAQMVKKNREQALEQLARENEVKVGPLES